MGSGWMHDGKPVAGPGHKSKRFGKVFLSQRHKGSNAFYAVNGHFILNYCMLSHALFLYGQNLHTLLPVIELLLHHQCNHHSWCIMYCIIVYWLDNQGWL